MTNLTIKIPSSLAPYGILFLRVAFGVHLLYYSWTPIVNLNIHSEATWLASMGVPMPELSAWAYLCSEFLGGFALLTGFSVRLFAIPLIVTFLVACFMVHWGDPYIDAYPAFQMLAISLFFLFTGAGKLSIDEWLSSKSKKL